MKIHKKLYIVLIITFLPIIGIIIYILLNINTKNSSILEYIPYNKNNFFQFLYLKFDNNYYILLNSLKNKQIYSQDLYKKFQTFIKNTEEIAFYKSISGNKNIEFAILKLKPNGNIQNVKKSILGKPGLNFKLIDEKNKIYIYSQKVYEKPKINILQNKLINSNIKNNNILFLSNIDQNELKQYLPKNTNLNIKNLFIKGKISDNISLSIQTIFKDKIKNILYQTFKSKKITNFKFKSNYNKYFSKNDILDLEIFSINTLLENIKPLLIIGLYNAWNNSVPEQIKNIYTEKDFEKLLNIFDNNIGIKIYPDKNFIGINIYTKNNYLYNFFNKFRPIIISGLGEFITGDIKTINEPNKFGFSFKTKLGNNEINSKLVIAYTGGISILSLGDIKLYNTGNIKNYYNTNTILWGYFNGKKLFDIIDKNLPTLPIQTYQEDLLKISKIYFNLYLTENKAILDLNINLK